MTFWSADEQLCHLWLQTLRELLESLSTCASERSALLPGSPAVVANAGLSDLTQVDVMDPFDLFFCLLRRGPQRSGVAEVCRLCSQSPGPGPAYQQ